MERLRVFALVLLVSGQVWGLPNPDAEAQAEALPVAEADAEADPDADPQNMVGYPSSAGMYSFPSGPVSSSPSMLQYPGGGAPDSCGMAQQCCNFADQNCCMDSQPKCYTKYVQDCKWQNKPRCEQRYDRKCMDYDVIGCRLKVETRRFKLPGIECKPRLDERCVEYERTYCNFTTAPHKEPVQYTEQMVEQMPDQVQKCFKVPSCRIEDIQVPIKVFEPEKVCDNITIPQIQCVMVPQEGPAQTVPQQTFITKTVRVCYDKPVYKCRDSDCGQPCPGQATQCSQGTVPQTICPISGLPDNCGSPDFCNSCQQVDVPNCNAPNNCQQPQRCCYWTYEKVWVDKVIRVPQITYVSIPGKVTYVKKCTNIPTIKQHCRIVNRPVIKYVTQQKCVEEPKEECIMLDVPRFEVKDVPKEGEIPADYKTCERVTKTEKFCKRVEVDVECRDNTQTQEYILKYPVCDQRSKRKACGNVPYSYCVNNGENVCTTVPKTICPQTCNPSPQCNSCSDYYNSGSAQPCGTGQCNAFYSPYQQSPGSAGYMPVMPLQQEREPTILLQG